MRKSRKNIEKIIKSDRIRCHVNFIILSSLLIISIGSILVFSIGGLIKFHFDLLGNNEIQYSRLAQFLSIAFCRPLIVRFEYYSRVYLSELRDFRQELRELNEE